jgi:hypothetical protein
MIQVDVLLQQQQITIYFMYSFGKNLPIKIKKSFINEIKNILPFLPTATYP